LFNYNFFQQRQDTFNVFRKFIDRLRNRSQVLPLTFMDAAETDPWQFTLPGITVYPNPSAARQTMQQDLASAQNSIAIDWPARYHPAQHFALASLRSGVNVVARGAEATSMVAGLPNTNVWHTASFSSMGIVGIDQQILWIYTSPNAQVPIFRIALPKTVNLLYAFFQLMPSDTVGSVAQSLASNEHPFGSCEQCTQPFWPQPAQNQFARPRISCVNHPQQGRNMNLKDATLYAQFMKHTCGVCRSSLRGAQNGATGHIFLTCSRSSCNWRTSLNQII
jgi:hypothetical protein